MKGQLVLSDGLSVQKSAGFVNSTKLYLYTGKLMACSSSRKLCLHLGILPTLSFSFGASAISPRVPPGAASSAADNQITIDQMRQNSEGLTNIGRYMR